MKKSTIILLVVIGVLLIIALWFTSAYNGLVSKEESVTAQWANVENVYQRRADLIPNLVNTVKGYAEHEQSTLTAVIDARAKATSVNINAEHLTEESIAVFQQAQDALSGAISRLLVSVERYPDLKANQNFMDLQAQLEGTENRIAVERRKYNEEAQIFNRSVRSFPTNIIAGMFGFEKKGYFKAAEGSETAPQVQF
ncbi:MAG: LemA family protein [Bacteroidales bacterium]|jgi:LemA protein|nr:LemA family protein [Bacteroidales bacterium]